MIRTILLATAALSLCGCGVFQGRPVVTTQQTSCTTLIPPEWEQGVAGVPLPALDSSVGELFAALDGQTGKLDQANGRTRDSIGIVKRCEARDAEAVRRGSRGFFGRLFG